jgi:hypothetical protein
MRNVVMARRMDEMAERCELEADLFERAGNPLAAAQARQKAADARRAAAILRGGPEGVRDVFAA